MSKTDPKGNGALRRHGCTCHVKPKRCPVKAARTRKIYDYGTKPNTSSEDPFLCAKKNFHEPPSKGAMEEAFRLVASELGWSIAETKDIILAR